MTTRSRSAMAIHCAAVGALTGLAAALGVFARGDGATQIATSVRGIDYEIAANGVYAFNAQRVVAEGVGWDAFTLGIVAPAMLLAALFMARGSIRALLVAEGLLVYLSYAYLEYSITWAFGPLFLLFIVIVAASVIGMIWLGVEIAESAIASRFGDAFPRRGWVALSVAMSALLVVMWSGRIWQALNGKADELLLGETTMTVQALDLGLVVPVTLLIAWLAWRQNRSGYVLSAVYVVFFVAMAGAITSMLISAGLLEGSFEWPPIIIFGFATAVATYLGWRMYGQLDDQAVSRTENPVGATAAAGG